MSKVLDEICLLLETYRGRDKIIRLLCYMSRLIGGLYKDENISKKFLLFSSEMSRTRIALQLLDDLPLLQHSLKYGLGTEEPDIFMAQLGVLTNIVDNVYYPIEKVAWLSRRKIMHGISNKWDIASAIFSAVSLYLTLTKTLRYIVVLQKHKGCVKKSNSIPVANLVNLQKYETLMSIKLLLDFIHAVNILPPGILWSSKLKTWHVGFLGTISSVLGIYQVYYRRYLKIY